MDQNKNYPGPVGPNQVSSFKKKSDIGNCEDSFSLLLTFLSNLLFFLLKYSWFTMLCFRCIAKWFSFIHTHTHTHTYIVFKILFPYRLLQNIEYASLCYIVGPCWLFTLKKQAAMIPQPQENELHQPPERTWKQILSRSGLQIRRQPSQHADFSLVRPSAENPLWCAWNSDLQNLCDSK